MTGETVLITGGARGLGLIFAELYARRGAKVAICSRTPEDLEHALEKLRRAHPETRLAGYVADVSREDEVRGMVAHIERDLGPIEILVNNAGVILSAPIEEVTLEDFRISLDSNLWGMIQTSLAVLPAMRERGHGKILNVTSVGGVLPVPHLAAYSTAKFGAVGFSTSLALAERPYGITVTTAAPTLMRTGSYLHARFKGDHAKEYGWFAKASTLPFLSKSAVAAAEAMIRAADCGQAFAVVGMNAKLGRMAFTLFPNLFLRVMTAVDRALPHGKGREGKVALEGYEISSGLRRKPETKIGARAAEVWNERSAT